MNEPVRLSVIIPIYNVAAYFQGCLDSLAQQELDGIEIILVNDGSTDRSADIARAFQKQHANQRTPVTLIEQANAGQGAARNRGLDAARGNYIYFLDADDELEPDSLAPLWAMADSRQLDILLFDRYDVRSSGNGDLNRQPSGRTLPETAVMSGPALFARLIAHQAYSVLVTTLLVRRTFLEQQLLRFHEGINHEDELFMFQLILCSSCAQYSPKRLYNHRIRPGSVMTGQSIAASFNGNSTVFMGMADFLKQCRIGPDAWPAVRLRWQKTLDNALSRYCLLAPSDRRAAQPLVRRLKTAIRQAGYLGKLKYRLFCRAEPVYRLAFTVYHSVRRTRL